MVDNRHAKLGEAELKIKHQRKHHKEKEKEWKAERAVLICANEATHNLLASESTLRQELEGELSVLKNTQLHEEVSKLSRHLAIEEGHVKELSEQAGYLEAQNASLKLLVRDESKKLRYEKRNVMLLVLQRSIEPWQCDLLHQYLDSLDEERTILSEEEE